MDEWVPKIRLIVPWKLHDTWREEELNQIEATKLGEPESDNEYMAVLHVLAAYRNVSVFNVAQRRQE